MVTKVTTNISTIFDGAYSYIYIWFSKVKRVVYVGQTNSQFGTFSRGYQHIGQEGTLRYRFYEKTGEMLEAADDWKLLSFRLPKRKKYTSLESSYRLAIEYLIQVRLHELRGGFKLPFKIISNVTYNDYCNDMEVQSISSEILESFKEEYSFIE